MRTELFCLLSFGGFAAVSFLCGILVWPQLVAAWPSIEEAIDRFRRLPPLAKLVLMLFVGAFVVYGSTKTNGVGGVDEDEPRCAVGRGLRSAPEMESTNSSPAVAERHALPVYDYPPPTVTPEDIAPCVPCVSV